MISNQVKLLEKAPSQKFKFVAQYGIKNEDYPTHSHDFNELFIILSGQAIHRIGRGSQPIEKGDVFLIKNKELEHSFENPKHLELYNFMFDDSFLEDAPLDLFQLEGYQTLFVLEPFFVGKSSYQNKLKLNVNNTSGIFDLARRIFMEYSDKKPGYMTLTKALFTELLVVICRELSNKKCDSSGYKLVNFGKAVSYMESNFDQQVTIKEMARIAALSQRQFIRKFKACYKETPLNYLIKLRIKYAKELLKDQPDNIKDVAYLSGFTDPNYFSRRFKELEGVSPSKFKTFSI